METKTENIPKQKFSHKTQVNNFLKVLNLSYISQTW